VKFLRPANIRTRLALWFVAILASVLVLYIAAVFVFQYVLLQRQIFHDEIQDVETVEGLLHFDAKGELRLEDSYHSHMKSRLLEDRLMEVRDMAGDVLYRSETLKGDLLGGSSLPDEGVHSYNPRSVTLASGTHVLLISHVHPIEGRPVLIRLGYSMAPLHDRMLHFFLLLLFATPVALVAVGFAGFSIARRALRPLEMMAARAEKITASNLHDRIAVESPHDELGHMARVLNHLLERLQQAFVQLQRFTADAAHELRTPLAAIRSTGEIALSDGRPETGHRDAISGMLEETIRLNQTIDGLLLLAKAEAALPDSAPTSFSLIELMEEILVLLDVLIEERHIVVVKDYGTALPEAFVADRSMVRVAFLNVLHNAVKFSPSHSELHVGYSCIERDGRRFHHVSIHDSGPGIAAGEHLHVFERFFTSAVHQVPVNSGAGLGLSIARLVIDRIGGRIFFDERVDQGARCCIELPLPV
jgi:signal transduction histidine kinase